MPENISLPRLTRFYLSGFAPIFQSDVEMTLMPGNNIILGGNGLGKTTIMQAIIYGLTGGMNDAVEKIKSERWDHRYFRERISKSLLQKAFIEIDFNLGKDSISLRRGFINSDISALKQDNKWVEDPNKIQKSFNKILTKNGYSSPNEFSRLVNRLLYLSESRRSLAWDFDAQLRLMTLINQSFNFQNDIQKQREELLSLDTQRRHLTFGIGRLRERIDELKLQESAEKNNAEELESVLSKNGDSTVPIEIKFAELVSGLEIATEKRRRIEDKRKNIANELSEVSTEVDNLRVKIEAEESAIIAESLNKQDIEDSLVLEKITSKGICPACGTQQKHLKAAAQKYLEAHQCLICGSNTPVEETLELSTLRFQLDAKTDLQNSFQEKFRELTTQIDQARQEESDIQFQINEIQAKDPILPLIERSKFPSGETVEGLEQQIQGYSNQETELRNQIIQRQNTLENNYALFRSMVDSEVQTLKEIYEKYATEFLGIKCELEEIQYSEKGVRFTSFIPKFSGIRRKDPDSCSEAQRFFLDIAFRMALIELVAQRKKENATFICETPENALDVSYIDNVVRMFKQFTDENHSLLLTANIQNDGIAQKILKSESKKDKRNRVLNLLDIGNLSEVHQSKKNLLNKILNEIFN